MTLNDFTTEFILSETKKLQYLFGLKKVIRYNQTRSDEDLTESVAEHLYGMMILVQYFLPLEDPSGTLNRSRIYELVTLHDIDEIETGDILGWAKTPDHRAAEAEAFSLIKQKSPDSFTPHLESCYVEYKEQQTTEARFVKAIDKIEPFFHVYNDQGRALLKICQTTAERSLRIKTPYIEEFQYIKKFANVIHQAFIDGDYYWREENEDVLP